MNWDDLRVYLALVREGSVRPAARRLGVSHSTVTRRLQSLEARLRVRLFDRTPDGFVMTTAGEKILESAEIIEEQANGLERDVAAADRKLEGAIRVTVPNALTHSPVMADFAGFAARYPDIDLEIVETYDYADLSRREADIAIRFLRVGVNPPAHLVGRRAAVAHNAVYVAASGLRDPQRPTLIGWGDRQRHPDWIGKLPVPKVAARHTVPDALGQIEACASGMGYAVISCMLGDRDERLVRLEDHAPWPSHDVWLLTHPDIRETTRFRFFREFLIDALVRLRPQFEGKTGTGT